ncbi:MAG: ribonuclease PH [Clostridiales bacterium]|nr:ribonuclease PH [Clostridiales bacterium]
MRSGNRAPGALRSVRIETNFVPSAAGSALISCGDTRVLCTASVEPDVPPFKKGGGQGWLTAEYAMLPASTGRRKPREFLKRDGRSVEIQRLIGRALRACVDLSKLGERTIYIDCDVLQADGGTRCASITGGYVALCLAIDRLMREGALEQSPIVGQLAAVSAGIVDGVPLLDLEYAEDSRAQVDMNLVLSRDAVGQIEFVELQGAAEGRPFGRAALDRLMEMGERGALRLMDAQRRALADAVGALPPLPVLAIASANQGKLRELRTLLGDRYDVKSMRELGAEQEFEETGATFEENALIKARALSARTGLCAIADDSGLAVDALGGRPGVLSARYAGSHGDDGANNRLLLKELADIPAPRGARFVCAMALVRPGLPDLVARGECEGEILHEYRGDGGFGYDPLFFSNELQMTFAEADLGAKNAVSHRARAIANLMDML